MPTLLSHIGKTRSNPSEFYSLTFLQGPRQRGEDSHIMSDGESFGEFPEMVLIASVIERLASVGYEREMEGLDGLNTSTLSE